MCKENKMLLWNSPLNLSSSHLHLNIKSDTFTNVNKRIETGMQNWQRNSTRGGIWGRELEEGRGPPSWKEWPIEREGKLHALRFKYLKVRSWKMDTNVEKSRHTFTLHSLCTQSMYYFAFTLYCSSLYTRRILNISPYKPSLLNVLTVSQKKKKSSWLWHLLLNLIRPVTVPQHIIFLAAFN